MKCLFVTHPEVVVDPSTPITRWGLSDVGRARAHAFARELAGQGWELLVSSDEQKAVETAEVLSASLDLPVGIDPALGENDRSATGYLPPEEFERTADSFFARPEEAVRGWEPAASAQSRIVNAVRRLSTGAPGRRIVFVGHGACRSPAAQ